MLFLLRKLEKLNFVWDDVIFSIQLTQKIVFSSPVDCRRVFVWVHWSGNQICLLYSAAAKCKIARKMGAKCLCMRACGRLHDSRNGSKIKREHCGSIRSISKIDYIPIELAELTFVWFWSNVPWKGSDRSSIDNAGVSARVNCTLFIFRIFSVRFLFISFSLPYPLSGLYWTWVLKTSFMEQYPLVRSDTTTTIDYKGRRSEVFRHSGEIYSKYKRKDNLEQFLTVSAGISGVHSTSSASSQKQISELCSTEKTGKRGNKSFPSHMRHEIYEREVTKRKTR